MRQSEPANPSDLRAERNPVFVQEAPIAAEVEGYCDLGMKRQTLRLTEKILKKRSILPEEFDEAVRAIGVHGSSFKKWKPRIEAAYDRQSRDFKRKVRPYMLDMYASLQDWEKARRFISLRNAWTAGEMFWSMEALLALDMLDQAKRLARRLKKVLPFACTRFDASLFCEALASFYARTHQWEKAIAMWEEAPLEQPFRRNALSGIVQIHLGGALEAVERGLRIVAELQRNPDNELEVCLPGNDLGMTREAEKELLKFKRGIEKLLPEETRKELGIAAKAN